MTVLTLAPSEPEPERRVDPAPDVTWPSPSDPLEVAHILADDRREDGVATLQRWRDSWWEYRSPCWVRVPDSAVRPWVYSTLRNAAFVGEQGILKPWRPTRDKVNSVLDAYASVAYLRDDVEPGTWLPSGEALPDAIAMPDGLFNVATRQRSDATPQYFTTWSLPFCYSERAPEPATWLAFLASVWPDDPDTIAMLQEWMGYLISGRTDQQKGLLLVGPRRSGKGTILRVCTQLVGKVNTAASTLASLTTNFGLEAVIGKSLLAVGDARLSGGAGTLVERLLSIIGEDTLTVDRKYEKHWTGRLPARVMIASNEVPDFRDASGAIGSRFMVARMLHSFYDREDVELEDKLIAELPGILNWALDGLDRLTERGRFLQSSASVQAREEMEESESPVSQFLDAACVMGDHQVPKELLYRLWDEWRERHGYSASNVATFGRQLRAAEASISTRKMGSDGRRVPSFHGVGVRASYIDNATPLGRVGPQDAILLSAAKEFTVYGS